MKISKNKKTGAIEISVKLTWYDLILLKRVSKTIIEDDSTQGKDLADKIKNHYQEIEIYFANQNI